MRHNSKDKNKGKKPRVFQKRKCYFTENKITTIDYKDLDLLSKFVSESGKITPGRITGTKAMYQRKVTRAVKLARFLALIPYCDSHRYYSNK